MIKIVILYRGILFKMILRAFSKSQILGNFGFLRQKAQIWGKLNIKRNWESRVSIWEMTWDNGEQKRDILEKQHRGTPKNDTYPGFECWKNNKSNKNTEISKMALEKQYEIRNLKGFHSDWQCSYNITNPFFWSKSWFCTEGFFWKLF